MCGICGRLNFDAGASVEASLVKAMADTIYHRGPDDDGYYVSGQLGFGFRRLSIIDLNTGHQPISNEDGTVWVVLNGEIYNYQELREELAAKHHHLATRTDTEVIVHLYEELGVKCLERLRGMFAFALWDAKNRTLMLARDRIGIKPLYYAVSDDRVTFASEIKGILADPDVPRQVHAEVIDRFLTFNYLPGSETLFQGILKVPPGSYLLVQDGHVSLHQYLDLDFTPRPRTLADAMEELDALLKEAVQLHLVSDVPVGVLLSGGVDSAAVLSYATEAGRGPLSTFTLGFDAPGLEDEREYARVVARANGAVHYDLSISSAEFRDFLPRYVWHMEEPVCEPPGVALYYVSRLAGKHVKVLLSGEGGDEAFAGYQTYRNVLWAERLKTILGPASAIVGRALAKAAEVLNAQRVANYAPLLSTAFEDYYYSRTSGPKAFFIVNKGCFYSKDFGALVDGEWSVQPVRDALRRASGYDLVNKMLYVDSKSWLPDDLLVKADKMTMANSIELRVPLLDHRLLEFAASLPGHFKVRRATTNYVAKKVLGRRVPSAILSRRKTGFLVPYASWLRTDLRDWLSGLLLDPAALARGYFNGPAIERLIARNAETGRFSKELFSLAVLELWHHEYVDPARIRH